MNKESKIKNINETELESRIDTVLRKVFPTFHEVKIEHQKSFSIKFGHHNVTVDLNEPSERPSRAIFDILVKVNDVNTILLELKKPTLTIDADDVAQGISYARLIHPIPPLTLISNGTDNQFYNSYTKEKIDRDNIDIIFIQELIDNTFTLATNDFKNAISLLLNHQPEIFSKTINQKTQEKFNQFIGNINDFSKPISADFIIERKNYLKNISLIFSTSNSIVGIVGPAFSGKTNLLYQFFKSEIERKNYVFYIDCHNNNYTILQELANYFSAETKILITKDKVREWLFNSLNSSSEGNFYLLIDNFNNNIPEKIKEEIIELIDTFKRGGNHVLYTIDEYNYKKLAFIENRKQKTIIGEQSSIIELDELDDHEYHVLNELLFNKYKLYIENGGHYTIEYRQPRILRHLLSGYKNNLKENEYCKIDAVPNLSLLNITSNNGVYTNNVLDLYEKITVCFFNEKNLRDENAQLNTIATGTGAITANSFKKYYRDDYDNLIRSSVIVFRTIQKNLSIIYPKFPELIASYSISIISNIIIEAYNQKMSVNDISNIYLDLVLSIPFSDIVGVGVLTELEREESLDLFSKLIQELIQSPPYLDSIKGGTQILLYSEGVGHIDIDFKDDMDDGGFITNFLPYVILSQLVATPIGITYDNKTYSHDYHHELLYILASNKEIIHRMTVRSWKNMKSIETFYIKDVGHFIGGEEGIIEPIVESILNYYLQLPEEIIKLYERGFKENNTILLYRVYLALRTMKNNTNEKLANIATRYVERFSQYFTIFLAEQLSKEEKNEEKRKELKEKILSLISKNNN